MAPRVLAREHAELAGQGIAPMAPGSRLGMLPAVHTVTDAPFVEAAQAGQEGWP
jgi:hypothetical protein